jgi:uracil-DNA glycosylase
MNNFKTWEKFFNNKELNSILLYLDKLYKTKKISPQKGDVFNVFNKCNYNNLRVVIIGPEPSNTLIDSGIMFACNHYGDTTIDILKKSFIDARKPDYSEYYFDSTLESWLNQGVLLLRSSFTVELYKPKSHYNIWKYFIGKFIKEVSCNNPGLIFILLGEQAKTYKPYIHKNCYILEEHTPVYYFKQGEYMPLTVFNKTNSILQYNNNLKIKWYEKIDRE